MVTESDNIVAETAARIFADLADPQTINRARDDSWKEPLWRALSDAGLPLAWVPEQLGGAGASLADGFAILGVAGRYAVPVPLAETLMAGWLLARAGIAAPAGAMTVAPARPRDRIALNADGTLSGRAAEFPSPRIAKHIAVVAAGDKGAAIALVKTDDCRVERRPKSRRRRVGQRDLRARETHPQRAGAGRFRSIRADADGRDRAQRADRRRAGSDPVAQRALRQ